MPRRKSREPEEFQVRLAFKGKWAHIFATVKNYYNLKSNADVVRLLVNNAFKEIMKEGVPPE